MKLSCDQFWAGCNEEPAVEAGAPALIRQAHLLETGVLSPADWERTDGGRPPEHLSPAAMSDFPRSLQWPMQCGATRNGKQVLGISQAAQVPQQAAHTPSTPKPFEEEAQPPEADAKPAASEPEPAPVKPPTSEAPQTGGQAAAASTQDDARPITDAYGETECIQGGLVAFIGLNLDGSFMLRGQMMAHVLPHVYNVSADSILVNALIPYLEEHRPTACVLVKMQEFQRRPFFAGSKRQAIDACRNVGAFTVLDCIDNPECASTDHMSLNSGLFAGLDALLVQTQAHLALVQRYGMRGAVVPHPHFNFQGWSPKTKPRKTIAEVGILVGDPVNNMPDDQTLHELADACCEHGVTLKLVLSENTHRLPLPPVRVVDAWSGNCSTSEDAASARQRQCRLAEPKLNVPHPPKFAAGLARRVAAQSLLMAQADAGLVQAQQPYYISPDGALDKIDVALLWSPPKLRIAQDGEFAVNNRPPTRIHWWFSHGHPVLADGHMEAYKDAGQRVGYPPELLSVSSASMLSEALCSIADPGTRAKLQELSKFGGVLSSPVVAGEALLGALCTLKKGWTSSASSDQD